MRSASHAPRTAAARIAGAAALWLAAASHTARAQDEVPFITTPDNVTVAMLELAGVTAADHVLDLGSGDGRIVITAAKRFGASGVGVEIVGELVQRSRAHARTAGVAQRVAFHQQDLFTTDLTRATVVTMYLLPEVNLQLRPRLLALAAGTRIVSHDWDMGEWLPDRSVVLDVPDKAVGLEKKSRVFLWTVPAQVQGTWCHGSTRLDVTQRFQRFSATLHERGATGPLVVFDGRIDGRTLRTEAKIATAQALLQLEGDVLKVLQLSGAAATQSGREFKRASGAACAG